MRLRHSTRIDHAYTDDLYRMCYLLYSATGDVVKVVYSCIHTPTHAVQDPSVMAATFAQPGVGQDDYNPFTDEGPPEKEPEV